MYIYIYHIISNIDNIKYNIFNIIYTHNINYMQYI